MVGLNTSRRWLAATAAVRPSHNTLAKPAIPAAIFFSMCSCCQSTSINERMKMARVDHLERAARAGVDGALAELVEEGPFGDPTALTTRPGDPLVKEWKERINGMLNEQAEQGYWASLYQLFTGFWFGHPAIAADRQSALAYGMALRDIMVKLDGVPEQQAIPFNGPFLDEIGTGLTPDEKARAQAHADAIVARAAGQRGISKSISIERKK
jgi:hypothetical protein